MNKLFEIANNQTTITTYFLLQEPKINKLYKKPFVQ